MDGQTYLEVGDTLDDTGDDVKLLLCSLVVVSLPLEPDPDSTGRGLDTSRPNGLVQSWADSDILDTHRGLSELLDGLDGLWCLCECVSTLSPGSRFLGYRCDGNGGRLTLLESNIVDTLVQVNGVFTGHDIVQSGSLLGGLGS